MNRVALLAAIVVAPAVIGFAISNTSVPLDPQAALQSPPTPPTPPAPTTAPTPTPPPLPSPSPPPSPNPFPPPSPFPGPAPAPSPTPPPVVPHVISGAT